jgi:hypothetical protein
MISFDEFTCVDCDYWDRKSIDSTFGWCRGIPDEYTVHKKLKVTDETNKCGVGYDRLILGILYGMIEDMGERIEIMQDRVDQVLTSMGFAEDKNDGRDNTHGTT